MEERTTNVHPCKRQKKLELHHSFGMCETLRHEESGISLMTLQQPKKTWKLRCVKGRTWHLWAMFEILQELKTV